MRVHQLQEPTPPTADNKLMPTVSQRLFDADDIRALEAELAEALAHPGKFHAAALIATAKIAVTSARKYADRLALRLNVAEKALTERDQQLRRHSEHLQRLENRIQAVERFKADK